jgi:hypothetical protein
LLEDVENAAKSFIVPIEEFSEDLDIRLGRANGNVYHRKPGKEGVHDGQIMIRLKKKRYIIIDYGIVPTKENLEAALNNPHIAAPDGAGKAKCVQPECPKVGVPVLLYDSDPSEPSSLYLRSGLCFTCQRNLNEKRRTQRKRKSDPVEGKRAKENGDDTQQSSDALVISIPMDCVKKSYKDLSSEAIASDIETLMQYAVSDTEGFLNAIRPRPEAVTSNATSDVAVSHLEQSQDSTTALNNRSSTYPADTLGNNQESMELYEKAFASMGRALYALTQLRPMNHADYNDVDSDQQVSAMASVREIQPERHESNGEPKRRVFQI